MAMMAQMQNMMLMMQNMMIQGQSMQGGLNP